MGERAFRRTGQFGYEQSHPVNKRLQRSNHPCLFSGSIRIAQQLAVSFE